MKVKMSQLLYSAQKGHYAIPAMNYMDFSSAKAYTRISQEKGLPLILAFAQSHTQWLSLEEAAAIGSYFQQVASSPIVLHLDHGQDFDFIKRAIALGFNSVMIDASLASFEDNIAKSKEVLDYAHQHHVEVEAEIGFVGSNENTDKQQVESQITSVAAAQTFYQQTQVDSLAISIGTAHGLYKGTPQLHFDRLRAIRDALPIPLVLHGGSSSGAANLSRCAKEGIAKINIFSDVMAAAYEARKDSNIKDYPSLVLTMQEAMGKVLEHYYDVFATERIKV